MTKLKLKNKNKKQKEKRESYSIEFKLDAVEKYFSRKKLNSSLTARYFSYELCYKGSRVSYSTFKRWIREFENLKTVIVFCTPNQTLVRLELALLNYLTNQSIDIYPIQYSTISAVTAWWLLYTWNLATTSVYFEFRLEVSTTTAWLVKVHPFMYSKFSRYSVTGDKFPLLLESEGTQRTSSTCGWLAMAIYLKSSDVTN